ncbi:iron uptake system protein EfeO [Neisseria sp. Ec49-e6-T10]|uniref:iron uptake system protein EfeO n=1 Tax=Neisseria sp. Ec49-e6-T10 TaxID=3140744 RepID=UPI003EBF1C84
MLRLPFIKSITLVLPIIMVTGCSERNQTSPNNATDNIEEVKIAVLEHACEPMKLEINAGKTRFLIENKTQRAVEWEILKGVRIIDERENIPPGFTQKLTTTLEPDTYEMTCGLLSNPRGTLIVHATKDTVLNKKPTPVELVGPIADYKIYTNTQVSELLTQAQQLNEAVKAGDLKKAQALYTETLKPYEHIEPVIKQFAALDTAIGADESVFKLKDKDPEFISLHRIEKGLFSEQSTATLLPLTEKLVLNIQELQTQIKTLNISAQQMVKNAQMLMLDIAQIKIEGLKNRYAHTDLASIHANTEGALKITQLLRPMLQKSNPELATHIEQDFAQINTILTQYQNPEKNGFAVYQQLTAEDKAQLKKLSIDLAEKLTNMQSALGLE